MPEELADTTASSAHSASQGPLLRLYHGSDEAIGHPAVGFNKGFADLGRGFYLTDDSAVARSRARSRARATGAAAGVVSAFGFDEDVLPWITLGSDAPSTVALIGANPLFGLRFAESGEGIVAWMNYIMACRAGHTSLEGVGEPAVVRAWIATEEVEMACSGLVSPEELAALIEPSELVVQYCFRNQALIDEHLVFVGAE